MTHQGGGMPRSSTTFRPGHPGMGGRPRNSPGSRNDWRVAAKRAAQVGRRADKLQSKLIAARKSTSLRQLATLARILRQREAAYASRAEHTRPVYRVRYYQMLYPPCAKFPQGVKVPDHERGEV